MEAMPRVPATSYFHKPTGSFQPGEPLSGKNTAVDRLAFPMVRSCCFMWYLRKLWDGVFP